MNEWDSLLHDLVGKPFQWNGYGPEGFGCWGLCAEAYSRLGRTPPGNWMANDWAEVARIISEESVSGRWRKVEVPEPLDIAIMGSTLTSHHVGIVTPHGVLNTREGLGAVVEQEHVLLRRYRRVEYYRWEG